MQALEIYLVMGGVPFYLKAIERGESAAQSINRLCFTANGQLYNEFDRLYSSLFYLRWIEPVANRIKLASAQANYWQSKSNSPEWKSWAGSAFEAFYYKQIDPIARALKIHTGFEVGTWRYLPKSKQEKGTQIDLLLDRDDGVINLVEIKYAKRPFRITKQYASQLGDKIDKEIHLTMITTSDLVPSLYSDQLVANEVTLEELKKGG